MRASIGFPSRNALSAKRQRVGECWSPDVSGDGTSEVLISPVVDDPVDVVGILAHELIHAAVGVAAGHGAPFRRVMRKIYLGGKPTATEPTDEFRGLVAPIIEALGPLPHARIIPTMVARTRKKSDECRLLKAECPECGYLVRVTRKWLDEAGAPLCPTDEVSLVCDAVSPSDPD